MDRRVARLAPPVLAALALAAAGCGSKLFWQLGLGHGTSFQVLRVAERGPYLDADLSGPFALRTFAPASGACRAVLAQDEIVAWREQGIGGSYARGGVECESAGIGEPLLERARQPRSGNLRSSAVPREQATFSVLREDADVVLLRGRFPLARLVKWPGSSDAVVAVPNTPECRDPIDEGVASMEYRDSGRPTLALLGGDGLCPIVGLLRPPGAATGDD